MSTKVLFVVPYPYDKAPSQRLKFEQYYTEFEKNGFEVTYEAFVTENFWKIIYKRGFYFKKTIYTLIAWIKRYILLTKIGEYDIVYIHLWATPFGLPIYEWLLFKLSKKVIYDIDDLIYLKKASSNNKFISIFKSGSKVTFLMSHANHVITCTPYLDNIARQYNKHTTDISSTINTDTYIPVNTYCNHHVLTLGWSGSHSTSKYLYLLTDVLVELKKRLDFKLLVIGDTGFKINGIDIEAVAWGADNEVELLQKIDIGLYPLPLNDQWVLGKSGLKALQYMALGIPTIATNVGCNDRVIENGVSGFLVKEAHEWLEKLNLLCENEQLRKQIGKEAKLRVDKYFSINANVSQYISILKSVNNSDN